MRKVWVLAGLVVGIASGQDTPTPEAVEKASKEQVSEKDASDAATKMQQEWWRRYLAGMPVSLWGLPGVTIDVTAIDPNAVAAGLTREAVQRVVELRLRVNKVPVLTPEQAKASMMAPGLTVEVAAFHDRGRFTVSVGVDCWQVVDCIRPHPYKSGLYRSMKCSNLSACGRMWSGGRELLVAATQRAVLDAIAQQADSFCLDFHKANEK